MEEKDSDNSSGMFVRVAIFLAVICGLIWFLSGKDSQEVSTDRVLGETEASGVFSQEASQVLGSFAEKIEAAIPAPVKTVIEEKIIKQTQKTVEESVLVGEIKETIEKATEQISGFPEKQQKDIKRQVIQQACDDLLKSVDEENEN